MTDSTVADPNAGVLHALKTIGQNEELRGRWVRELKYVEKTLAAPGLSVRDEITAPLIDALFADTGILRKRLANGVLFDFHYRSKIAREFAMSEPETPDHVWEPQTTKLLLQLARGAREVLVGGAYFGDHAILIANQLRGHGRVHAFEPNPDQNAMLKHNAAINELDNLVPWRLGLWHESSGRLRLVGDDALAHPEVDEQSADGFDTLAIDDYLAREGIERLDLIMLDIEGAELAVLRGAQRQLSRPVGEAPDIVFELHRHYVDWSHGLEQTDVVRYLAGFGYHVFAVRDYNANVDMRGQPVELIELEGAYLEGPPHGFNMVAVKDMAVLQEDTIRFCRGVSPKLLAHRDPALHQPL
jgi:FkbM family methyltransferase